MRRVDIQALKENLGEYVRAVETGETVLITEREQVVAELRPPVGPPVDLPVDRVAEANALRKAHGRPPLSRLEEKGVHEGWLRPATAFGPLPPRPEGLPSIPLEQLLADLAADREDR